MWVVRPACATQAIDRYRLRASPGVVVLLFGLGQLKPLIGNLPRFADEVFLLPFNVSFDDIDPFLEGFLGILRAFSA